MLMSSEDTGMVHTHALFSRLRAFAAKVRIHESNRSPRLRPKLDRVCRDRKHVVVLCSSMRTCFATHGSTSAPPTP
jgi:hypothetical protein